MTPREQALGSSIKIGLVVTTALFLMFFGIVNSECFNRNLIGKTSMYLRVPDAKGLRKGAAVWLQGIEVGRVGAIELQPEAVFVKIEINGSSLSLLHKDATASILSMGLLGDKYVELGRGTFSRPALHKGDTIAGFAVPGFDNVIAASATSAQTIGAFVSRLDTLIRAVQAGKGTLGALIQDSSLYRDVRSATGVIAAATSRYERGNGSLKRFIEDDSLYSQMLKVTRQLSELQLLIAQGDGTISRLINNPKLYQNADSAALRFRGLADSLMQSNSQFATSLSETVARLNEILEEFKKDPSKYFNLQLKLF